MMAFLAACNPLTAVNDHQYDDYASLAAAGEIEQGWAPDFLPASATDIHLKYDLDANAILMAFDFAPEDGGALARACTPLNQIFPPKLTAKWWPEGILGDAAAVFYECPNGYLAIRGTQGFYWSGVQVPANVITVSALDAHPDKYLDLDGKQVTVLGYVDFDNIHDSRETFYQQEGIGFVRKPGQRADAVFYAYFSPDSDLHPLFDELYALRPKHYEKADLQLLMTGTLHAYDQDTNFTHRKAYVIDVGDPANVVILK